MSESIILNTDGFAFDEFTANEVAGALTSEIGYKYEPAIYQTGYAVIMTDIKKPVKEVADPVIFEEINLRPAWRSQIPSVFMFFMSIVFVLFTDTVMRLIGLSELNNFLYDVIRKSFNWNWVESAIFVIASLVSLLYFIKIVYSIYAFSYFIGPKGLEMTQGIISRDKVRVEFKDIRAQNLKQSFFGRILGVGSIDIFTSGSNKSELSFINISNPGSIMKELIERKKH